MKKINIAIIVLALASLTGCKKYAEPEIFLIPEGVKKVIILFSQENGEDKQYDGDRRVYNIPKNGVLYSKFEAPATGSVLNQHFIYTDAQGRKLDTLPDITFSEKIEDKDYFLGSHAGMFSNLPKGGITQGSTSDYPKVDFFFFTLGKASEQESLFGEVQKLLDSVKEVYPSRIQ